MEKVTLNGVEKLDVQEETSIRNLIDAHSKDVHYLAFARQLFRWSPLNDWVKDNSVIMNRQQEIINTLLEKKEVCSLYPSERLSLYPIEMDDFINGYHADFTNNDKNFADILEINDNIYKSKYLVVDFDNLEFIQKQDFDLIISSLQDLLEKSKKLKAIYIREMPHIV